MAKSAEFGHKTRAARELLEKNPRMKVREVVETLAAQGITITPNLVYNLKSTGRRRRRRGAVRETARQANVNPAQIVIKLKELAAMIGGLRHLKQLVDALAE